MIIHLLTMMMMTMSTYSWRRLVGMESVEWVQCVVWSRCPKTLSYLHETFAAERRRKVRRRLRT